MVLFIFSFTLMVFAFCKSDYEGVSTFQKGIYRWLVTGFPVIFITPSNPTTHVEDVKSFKVSKSEYEKMKIFVDKLQIL